MLVVAATFAALLAAGGGRADAATTEIGAVTEVRSGAKPSATASGGFTVQIAEAAGSYAVPPGFATITSWTHSTGGTAGSLTFKVYRPTGATREFVAIASDTQTVVANTVMTFPVRIAVAAGDRIGLSSDDVELAYETFDPADRIGFFGADPPPGTTRATDGEPFGEFKLDVAATLDSDPDAVPSTAPPPPPPPPPPAATTPRPAVRGLTLAPRAFRAARSGPSTMPARSARSGTRVRYSVAVTAKVRFTVRALRPGRRIGSGSAARCAPPTVATRAARRCTRAVALPGSFVRPAARGARSCRFTGRLGGRTLMPGDYVLVAAATAGGRTGNAVRRAFRITR
jgi:hypothetical protein